MRGREIWGKEVRILQRIQGTITKGTIKGIINGKEMTNDNDQRARSVEETTGVNVGPEDQQSAMDAANQAIIRTLVQMLQQGLTLCPE